jgi:hypothetical protein
MVQVVVGERAQGTFTGFLAEFEGEEIASYVHEGVVYTLYRVTSVNFEGYRVHIADETNHKDPKYELLPYDVGQAERRRRYDALFRKADIAQNYPLFLKDMSYFQPNPLDLTRAF